MGLAPFGYGGSIAAAQKSKYPLIMAQAADDGH